LLKCFLYVLALLLGEHSRRYAAVKKWQNLQIGLGVLV